MKQSGVLQVLTLAMLIWLCFFTHSCIAGDPRAAVPKLEAITRPPPVQVGIGSCIRAEEARIRVEGACAIGPEQVEDFEAAITATEHGLKIGTLEFDTDRVPVRILQEGTLEVRVAVGGGKGKKPAHKWRRYHGNLVVLRDRGKVTLVNEVGLEDYLAGVVGREMSLSRGREALKAQVVAARTYAMCEVRDGRLRRVNGEKFDLFDDERSQVYGGMDAETTLARSIVEQTRGMFVLWEDRLVHTFYSSTCGGSTDPAWKVLGEGRRIPPLAGAACGYCGASKYYAWEARFTRREMAKKLFENEPNLKVRSVRIVEALAGGHAVKVGVTLSGHAKERVLDANRVFRRRLRLRSTVFEGFEEKKDEIVVRGRGWGHGAGMCQYGAYGMAAEGRSGIEILEHYFPGARVRKLY
ncbi:MAG: SpoIID/LytB domain-containing protein [Planctomycetota bacterium]|jgi:stage II sporulation protein D